MFQVKKYISYQQYFIIKVWEYSCHYPVGIYMFKVNNRNAWHHSGFFNVNFEHISHLALVFLLLTLGK